MINKESFESFRIGLMLAQAGKYKMASLVTFDATAISALRSVGESCRSGHTSQQQYLWWSSQKHLKIMSSQTDHKQQDQSYQCNKNSLKAKESSHHSLIDTLAVMQEQPSNSENVNRMNTAQPVIKRCPRAKVIELREIIRPEFRRKVTKEPLIVRLEHRTNHFMTESEDDQIPLLVESHNTRRYKMMRKDRSVSPKVEQGPPAVISSISRDCHTQTDTSFEIDLRGLQTVPKLAHNSNQIEQEEPWQCEEDELEEELRQIDERLSHRGNKTQEIKLSNFQTEEDYSPRNGPKKVRLSLSPIQVRSITPSKSRVTTPLAKKTHHEASKSQIRQRKKTYTVDYVQQNVVVSKWNKPSKGLLTTQISKAGHR